MNVQERLADLTERWLDPEKRGGNFRAGVVTAVLTVAVVAVVYLTGGTTYVYAHMIYLPVLVAAATFGPLGGVLTALVAGLLLGPYMPLEVHQHVPQPTINWVFRLLFLCFVGLFVGTLFALLREKLGRLSAAAYHDPETHLHNQLALREDIHSRIKPLILEFSTQPEELLDTGVRLYVVAFKLNNLSDVIGTLGLHAAQLLLQRIAELLEEAARDAGLSYRVATDEFALLVEDVSRRSMLDLVVSTREKLEGPHEIAGVPIYVDATAGVAAFPYHEANDAERLIRKAMVAMYGAITSGRTHASYDTRLDRANRETIELLGEMKRAIEQGQLVLHYQPKLQLETGRAIGVEALVRWNHPQRGMVPPGLFVPQAERTGLIQPLTQFVLETACEQLARWRAAGLEAQMAVNISARNFGEPDLVANIDALMRWHGIEQGRLELEVTESGLMADPTLALEVLQALKSLGVDISIDDFGTGYSSLEYLKRLPVKRIKVDQTFVRDLHTDIADRKIVHASIGLAHNLGLEAIAEGIEDAESMAILKAMKCDVGQGYHICRPQAAETITAWLHERAANAA